MIQSFALYSALVQDLTPHRYSWVETRSYAVEALLTSLIKKWEVRDDSADTAAVNLFLKMNNHCENVSVDVTHSPELGNARRILTELFYPNGDFFLTEENFQLGCGFGPGASVAARGNSFYQKSGDGPLSATNANLYATYVATLNNPTSYSAEITRRRRYGSVKLVQGSQLGCVPKNTEISRVICTEPCLNMFVQKGLGSCLEQVLLKCGIDLSRQPIINRDLARRGSVDGRLCTIDLSSASDTISLSVCRALLPAFLVDLLMECRSPTTTLPDGRVVPLHMMSSMGNGFTFPLQTILFYAIVCGVYKQMGIKPIVGRGDGTDNVGVFGDDIIVLAEAYTSVMSSLDACGFFPNRSKSYNYGFFRESCGGDYYKGHDVRGVYCRSLKTSHDIYSLVNRLVRWSAKHKVALPTTLDLLISKVKYIPIPYWEQDDAGIKVPTSVFTPKRASRAYSERKNILHGSYIYRALVSSADSVSLASEEDLRDSQTAKSGKNKLRNVRYNADGVLQAALKGSLRGCVISRRVTARRSKVVTKVAPGWDGFGWIDPELRDLGWSAWKHAAEVNLPLFNL